MKNVGFYLRLGVLAAFAVALVAMPMTVGGSSQTFDSNELCAYPCNPQTGWWCCNIEGPVPICTPDEWSGPPDG